MDTKIIHTLKNNMLNNALVFVNFIYRSCDKQHVVIMCMINMLALFINQPFAKTELLSNEPGI